MTRFAQLPVGQRFEFEGECFVKETPLLARNERTGAQRMVPRSAGVKTPDDARAPAPAHAPESLDSATVRSALAEHDTRMEALLAPLVERMGDSERDRFSRELAAAREALRERLKL